MEQYFEIYGGEDGVKVSKIDNIEDYLNELIEEEAEILEDFPETRLVKSRKVFNGVSCDYNEPTRVLIKGTIIVPRKKEVVTKWEID